MTDVGEKLQKLADDLAAVNGVALRKAPAPVLTEDEMHAKYADASRRLREIYGTTNEGNANAD